MTTSDIPTEALEAAARDAERAYTQWEPPAKLRWYPRPGEEEAQRQDRWAATVRAAAPHLIAEGRRQYWEELARKSLAMQAGTEPVIDEGPALRARLDELIGAKLDEARAEGIAEGRRQGAAAIRAIRPCTTCGQYSDTPGAEPTS